MDNNTKVKSGLATSSLVIGIVATVVAFGGFFPCLGLFALWVSVPTSLVGLALGAFAPKGSAKKPGMILGWVALGMSVLAGIAQGAMFDA